MAKSVTIHGNKYEIKVGSLIRPENWACYKRVRLEDGEGLRPYYLPMRNDGPITRLACDVELTGRTLCWINGDLAIRCKITIPSQGCIEGRTNGGWFFVHR